MKNTFREQIIKLRKETLVKSFTDFSDNRDTLTLSNFYDLVRLLVCTDPEVFFNCIYYVNKTTNKDDKVEEVKEYLNKLSEEDKQKCRDDFKEEVLKIKDIFKDKESFNKYIESLIIRNEDIDNHIRPSITNLLFIPSRYLFLFTYQDHRDEIKSDEYRKKIYSYTKFFIKTLGFDYIPEKIKPYGELLIESTKNHLFENEKMFKLLRYEENIIRNSLNKLSPEVYYTEEDRENFYSVFKNIMNTIEDILTYMPYDSKVHKAIQDVLNNFKLIVEALN